jgi:hypothetical protein
VSVLKLGLEAQIKLSELLAVGSIWTELADLVEQFATFTASDLLAEDFSVLPAVVEDLKFVVVVQFLVELDDLAAWAEYPAAL